MRTVRRFETNASLLIRYATKNVNWKSILWRCLCVYPIKFLSLHCADSYRIIFAI